MRSENESLKIQVEAFNSDHKSISALFKLLIDATSIETPSILIENIIRVLGESFSAHCRREDLLLDLIEYPGAETAAWHHGEAERRVHNLLELYRQGRMQEMANDAVTLSTLFHDHVETHDAEYAQFIAERISVPMTPLAHFVED